MGIPCLIRYLPRSNRNKCPPPYLPDPGGSKGSSIIEDITTFIIRYLSCPQISYSYCS